MIQLRECVSADDVRANMRATRARLLALKAWEPLTAPAPEPPLPPCPSRQQYASAAREFGWWSPRMIQIIGPDEPLPGPAQMFFEHPITKIAKTVCRYYGITLVDIRSERRTANVVRPRQIAMYLARTITGYSLPEIGRRFGGRDHTTALHAINRIEALRTTDPKIAADVDNLLIVLKRQPDAGL